jgi:hypothetical protein
VGVVGSKVGLLYRQCALVQAAGTV